MAGRGPRRGGSACAVTVTGIRKYSGVVAGLFLEYLFDQFHQMGGGRSEAGTLGIFGQRNQPVTQNERACGRRGGNAGIEAEHGCSPLRFFPTGTVENRNAKRDFARRDPFMRDMFTFVLMRLRQREDS